MHDSLRLRTLYALCRGVFWLVFGLFGVRRAVIRTNLARAFPELDPLALRRIERDFLARQAELAAETVYARQMPAEELRARMQLDEADIARLRAAAPPRPLVLAGGHLGNAEWMLLRLSLELGDGLLGLYKPIRNPRVDAWFLRLRTRFGARLVPAKSVLAELARFREARAIGLLADQAPTTSPEKHWTPFLSQQTAFYMGPELLARALRSQLCMIRVERLARGRYRVSLESLNEAGERLATGALSDRYAQALEREIRADPASWWWSHKRWKLKPPGTATES
jgi:KDO2-lipid IV(A) lauroyltransferase